MLRNALCFGKISLNFDNLEFAPSALKYFALVSLYKFFISGLILADAFALLACLRSYLHSRHPYVGVLIGWFASRFLSILLPYTIRVQLGWKTEQIMSFSALVEGFMMYLLFLSLLNTKNSFTILLFLLPITVFSVEFYFIEHYYDIMYVSHVFYYVFVSGLLIWLIHKENIPKPFISFVNVLLIYHATVFVYMLNLPFLSHSLELASYMYPLFWLFYFVFDVFCIQYFFKYRAMNNFPDAA